MQQWIESLGHADQGGLIIRDEAVSGRSWRYFVRVNGAALGRSDHHHILEGVPERPEDFVAIAIQLFH